MMSKDIIAEWLPPDSREELMREGTALFHELEKVCENHSFNVAKIAAIKLCIAVIYSSAKYHDMNAKERSDYIGATMTLIEDSIAEYYQDEENAPTPWALKVRQ